MKVVFRTDASLKIGSGHVMRCLTLAGDLQRHGANVLFLCRPHLGNLIDLIAHQGFKVLQMQKIEDTFLPSPNYTVPHASWLGCSWQRDAEDTIRGLGGDRPEWLVVDHYALDRRWENALQPWVNRIFVIDDLADRNHECDILLDQNYYRNLEKRYDKLTPRSCLKLLGPQYALLRPEFSHARQSLRNRGGKLNRILIFFGGVDPSNETAKALHAVSKIPNRQFEVDVVVGAGNLQKEMYKKFCCIHGFNYHCQIDNMAELMTMADLSIGACGATTWERCYLGLPSIILVLAANQAKVAADLAKLGIILSLGDACNVTAEDITNAITNFIEDEDKLFEMSKKATELFQNKLKVSSILLEKY